MQHNGSSSFSASSCITAVQLLRLRKIRKKPQTLCSIVSLTIPVKNNTEIYYTWKELSLLLYNSILGFLILAHCWCSLDIMVSVDLCNTPEHSNFTSATQQQKHSSTEWIEYHITTTVEHSITETQIFAGRGKNDSKACKTNTEKVQNHKETLAIWPLKSKSLNLYIYILELGVKNLGNSSKQGWQVENGFDWMSVAVFKKEWNTE